MPLPLKTPLPDPGDQLKAAGVRGWIFFGCIGVAVLCGLALAVGGVLIGLKFRNVEKQDTAAIARTVASIPGIELLSTDLAGGKLKIRLRNQYGRFVTVDAGALKPTSGKIPNWVPKYPEAPTTERNFAVSDASAEIGSYEAVINEPQQQLVKFFNGALETAGFTVQSSITADEAVLNAATASNQRIVDLRISGNGDLKIVRLVYQEKK